MHDLCPLDALDFNLSYLDIEVIFLKLFTNPSTYIILLLEQKAEIILKGQVGELQVVIRINILPFFCYVKVCKVYQIIEK